MPTNLITEADLRGLGAEGGIVDWFSRLVTPAAPKPNFEWSQIKAAGFTDAQIDAYLRKANITRWAAQRNYPAEGLIMSLKEYARTGTALPTHPSRSITITREKTRIGEKTPEQRYRETLEEGLKTDIAKYLKYLKYAAVAAGGLAVLWGLKTFKVL